MSIMEESRPYPSWQFRHTKKQQKVTLGHGPIQKDVKYEDRSGDVYENTGTHDKMSPEMPDIYAQLKAILQKIADF